MWKASVCFCFIFAGLFWKGMNNMITWKGLKNDLSISQEDQNAIALEKDLIRTMIAIREEKGLHSPN